MALVIYISSRSPDLSLGYSDEDRAGGIKILLVFRVMVGDLTRGNREMRKPPINR